jgi:hypothetical protein
MQVFPARFGAASSRLQLRTFELDVQRVHEAVHQAAESRNRRELDDFSRIEILRQLPKGLLVVASVVPRDQLGPPDDGFLTVSKKRTLQVVVSGQRVELLFGPSCCSPNQAIVLYSVSTLVQSRHFDHRQRPGPRVELAAQAVLLEHGLQGQQKLQNCR